MAVSGRHGDVYISIHDMYDGRETERQPHGERIARNWGALCFMVLCAMLMGFTKLKKPRGHFPFLSPASTTIKSRVSSDFPSRHTLLLILLPVSSLFSSRYSFFETELPRYYHFTSADLTDSPQSATWESFAQKKDGQSFPAMLSLHYTSCTLRRSIIRRKGGWSRSISHCLGTVAGEGRPSKPIDSVTAGGESVQALSSVVNFR
jgi:hypothetical protein